MIDQRILGTGKTGIKLDEESWYSVTPEKIAEHIANRVMREDLNVIVDGFCGAGGNTIQFALASPNVRVIAADIDANKIALAKHNAEIYGVDQRIEFIVADFLNIPKLLNVPVDAVFVSPPWGGPDYKNSKKYRLEMMTPDVDNILTACRALTPNIAFYLPRNIDEADLLRVAKCSFEVEQNILNNKLLTVTAYFGNLIKSEST
ncbi:hypothetical protein B4U80_02900 [Leptotrombidium deliense]|uniref:Trimethylguanosine synthase n=1 Tax=Leptotrombidium deliense TaxID=299467 RepID=A0A443SS36_9ACAR|nr:hypothetical protein B4U80_02900 [Leptotrombidium deliense]